MSGDPKSAPDTADLPAVIRGQVVSEIVTPIEAALPATLENRADVARRVAEVAFDNLGDVVTFEEATYSSSSLHIGPMPSPAFARGYHELNPAYVDRMFALAERDQVAFIESKRDQAKRDDRFRILSLGAGLLAFFGMIGGGLYAAFHNHEVFATALIGLGAGGIIATFLSAPSLIAGLRHRGEKAKPASTQAPQPTAVASDAAD